MLLINLKSAWRNLLRNPFSSVINISGLAVGITCCIFIALYVWSETQSDEFHVNKDNIVRANMISLENGRGGDVTAYPFGTALQNEFNEIKKIVRLGQDNVSLRATDEAYFYESKFFWTDSTFFDVFTFELVKGNPATALQQPYSLVLTESMAKKYFQDQDPIGKTIDIKIYDGDKKFSLTVTGVVKDMPKGSSIEFDFLAPMSAAMKVYPQFENYWNLQWVTTWALTDNLQALQARSGNAEAFYEKYTGNKVLNIGMEFQPLSRVHLYSGHIGKNPTDRVLNVYMFSIIGMLIFLLACINFVNISTARAELRKKEIGVRKTLGAFRVQLFVQFMAEALLTAVIVLIISLAITFAVQPVVSNYLNVAVNLFSSLLFPIACMVAMVLIGLFAGLYPAAFLSGFQPLEALKQKSTGGSGGLNLRQVLVVFQFTISIALIAGTLLIGKQVRYLKNADLGIATDQLITIPVDDRELQKKIASVKELMATTPGVTAVAATGENFPADMNNQWNVRWQGLAPDEKRDIFIVSVDADYLSTLNASFMEGRNLSKEFTSDDSVSVVINEAARDMMGMDAVIGKQIELDRTRTIVGVVKNIHHYSLHQKVAPIAYFPVSATSRACSDNVLIKISSDNIPATLVALKTKWATLTNDRPFEYRFVDDSFAKAYAQEEKFLVLFEIFSGLAIVIACLGLMGLSSFVVNKRSKEIGIRKVLGASIPQILLMLTRGFSIPIVIAFLISGPLIYYGISQWLGKFAYRIDVDIMLIVLAGFVAWLIAFSFIGFQSWKAARVNPVKILKDE